MSVFLHCNSASVFGSKNLKPSGYAMDGLLQNSESRVGDDDEEGKEKMWRGERESESFERQISL